MLPTEHEYMSNIERETLTARGKSRWQTLCLKRKKRLITNHEKSGDESGAK